MDKRKHNEPEHGRHYLVMAQVCEPKYGDEMKFVAAEKALVARKLAAARGISLPKLGFYGQDDWKRYEHQLEKYARQLEEYEEDVDGGILPVKFAVYNDAEFSDRGIHVTVKVKGGRVDSVKKPPERPERLDGGRKPWPKLTLPKPGFSRRNVRITPHAVSVVLSNLHAEDGAVLVNQLVHVHCGPETTVHYEVMSHNVAHETGDVEIQQAAAAT